VAIVCFRGDNRLWSIPIAGQMEAYLFDSNLRVNTSIKPKVFSKIKREKLNNA
jgi:hypothetical protein